MVCPEREGGKEQTERQREYDTFPVSKGANGTMLIKRIF